MAQIIKTVSVSKEEDDFLVANNISPTRLLRNKVQEMIEFQKGQGSLDELHLLKAKIPQLVETITRYAQFLDKKGILEEFSQLENVLEKQKPKE